MLVAYNEEGFLNTIASGNNKPVIYFPNTERSNSQSFVGKDSPFVAAGLVNPDYFDSSVEQEYESIQVCPESAVGHFLPINDNFPYCYVDEPNKSTVENLQVVMLRWLKLKQIVFIISELLKLIQKVKQTLALSMYSRVKN